MPGHKSRRLCLTNIPGYADSFRGCPGRNYKPQTRSPIFPSLSITQVSSQRRVLAECFWFWKSLAVNLNSLHLAQPDSLLPILKGKGCTLDTATAPPSTPLPWHRLLGPSFPGGEPGSRAHSPSSCFEGQYCDSGPLSTPSLFSFISQVHLIILHFVVCRYWRIFLGGGPHPCHMEVPRLGSYQSCSCLSIPQP